MSSTDLNEKESDMGYSCIFIKQEKTDEMEDESMSNPADLADGADEMDKIETENKSCDNLSIKHENPEDESWDLVRVKKEEILLPYDDMSGSCVSIKEETVDGGPTHVKHEGEEVFSDDGVSNSGVLLKEDETDEMKAEIPTIFIKQENDSQFYYEGGLKHEGEEFCSDDDSSFDPSISQAGGSMKALESNGISSDNDPPSNRTKMVKSEEGNGKKAGNRPYKNYPPGLLEKILEDVKNKRITARRAHKRYGIHRNVIYNRMKMEKKNGSSPPRNPGRQPVLSELEENIICAHVITLHTFGFPINQVELRLIVKNYLAQIGRTVPEFKDNLPGKKWVNMFLKRHKKLSMRVSQSVSRYRAGIDVGVINEFFDNLETELQGIPPERIWNYDESKLADDPDSKEVMGKRDCKHPQIIENACKVSTSIMMCGNAAGELAPVYVTFNAENVNPDWAEGGPPKARFNHSESGWFDMQTFEDWFEFCLLPLLSRQAGKKVIIGDNLSSHISRRVIMLCEQNDIRFLALPTNSTHLLQPLDVGLLGPLKKVWRTLLNEWKTNQQENRITTLPKSELPKLLKKLIEELELKMEIIIKGGFRSAGIHPIDRERILKKLYGGRLQNEDDQVPINNSHLFFISELQEPLEDVGLADFQDGQLGTLKQKVRRKAEKRIASSKKKRRKRGQKNDSSDSE